MAVVIYKKGTTHIINGIQCEAKRVSHKLFSGQPEPGWFFSPEEAYKEIEDGLQEKNKTGEKAEVEIKEEITEEKADYIKDAKVIDGMDNDEIRLAAEKAGIEKFDTARIETLKRKLKA